MKCRKLLLPVDGSSRAEALLPLAREAGETILCWVLEPTTPALPGVAAGMGAAMAWAHREQAESDAQRAYLARLAAQLSSEGLIVSTRQAVGFPPDEIVRLAEQEGVDLIAMASHGRRGLKRWLHGSVAESVARQAPCPVLLLTPGSQKASA